MSRKIVRTLVLLIFPPILLFLLYDALFPFRPRLFYATQVTDQRGTVIHAFLSKEDKWRLYSEVSEITPVLRKALIYKEDKYFDVHPGINPLAMLRAAARNIFTGRRTSGASTITMQVVRLMEPRPRTYANKLLEILRAFQLELHHSKAEILQYYVNLVPYGSNIEGIKAASLLYFGKPPQLLSLAEITALAIIPNRPSSLRPGKHNDALKVARDQWLNQFAAEKIFDENVVADALREPLEMTRRQAPRLAPHFALRLKQEFPDEPVIRTALRIQLQDQVEEQVRNYINRRISMNIHNAAVLVVDNQTMEVVTYVGSADFHNPYDGGQVDGVRAVRSPGSTLKPLLYALAFDKGIVTPKTMLLDVPVNFSGYEPENFDQHFNGAVTTEFALANSLNIPAVRLLKETGTSVLIEKLSKAGFKTVRRQAGDLGLSMILGGCGVSLEELTRLFSAFSNEGNVRNLRYTSLSAPDSAGIVLVSPEAAFLVNTVLTNVSRPDLPTNFDNTYHLPRIAWKTGTSYGKRDAWSIGYNQRFTVGVWVGNFSGEGVPELSGANTATPLLFSIFNTLDYDSPRDWYKTPPNVSFRKVCAASGEVPGEFCTHVIPDYYLPGVSSYRTCAHVRQVFTDLGGKIAYCTRCLPATGFQRNTYANLAPELIAFYETQKVPYQKIPPHNPDCERIFDAGPPRVVSPNEGSTYYIRKDEPQQLQLACQAANDVQEVFWYVNDKLIWKAAPNAGIFINPPPGRVKISCSDDKGRNTDVWIAVRRM